MYNKRTLPHIKLIANNREVDAFIDTGAAANVVRAGLLDVEAKKRDSRHFTMACGNDVVKSLGTVTLNLEIQGEQIKGDFAVIEGLNEELILGAPFLEQEGVHLDYVRKCMYVGRTSRKTVHWIQEKVDMQTPAMELNEKLHIPDEADATLKPTFQEYSDIFSERPTKGLNYRDDQTRDTFVYAYGDKPTLLPNVSKQEKNLLRPNRRDA